MMFRLIYQTIRIGNVEVLDFFMAVYLSIEFNYFLYEYVTKILYLFRNEDIYFFIT